MARTPSTTIAIDGPAVRRLRKEAGMEVAELAEKAGCSRAHLTNIELGHRPRVSPTTFRRICEALELPRAERPSLYSEDERRDATAVA